MPRNQTSSYRLDDLTLRQLDELSGKFNTSKANVISRAIDRMYREETNMNTQTTINIVAQSGHAWTETFETLEEALEAIPSIVETHGDIERIELLNDDGTLDRNLYMMD